MVSERLKRVILKELELDEWDIAEATTAPEVPGWDSLSHVRIICAVENEYRVRFKTAEILQLKTIGQLQALVDRATAALT